MPILPLPLLALALSPSSEPNLRAIPLPADCEQVVLVTTPSWTATEGTMRLYQRTFEGWQRTGFVAMVKVGRSGMGWGRGAVDFGRRAGPVKREGDGRAPVGIFDLRTAFGKGATPPAGVTYPYRATDARDYWVDDANHPQYNSWQRIEDGPNDPKARWGSVEQMAMEGPNYELGIVVAHNMNPVAKGMGSAIFLHLWKTPRDTTAGCTSMPRETMEPLLRWLDAKRRPMLVQAPDGVLPVSR